MLWYSCGRNKWKEDPRPTDRHRTPSDYFSSLAIAPGQIPTVLPLKGQLFESLLGHTRASSPPRFFLCLLIACNTAKLMPLSICNYDLSTVYRSGHYHRYLLEMSFNCWRTEDVATRRRRNRYRQISIKRQKCVQNYLQITTKASTERCLINWIRWKSSASVLHLKGPWETIITFSGVGGSQWSHAHYDTLPVVISSTITLLLLLILNWQPYVY